MASSKQLGEDKLVIDLLYGERKQKFLFMVYKNINELLVENTKHQQQQRHSQSDFIVASNIISLKVNDISVIDYLKQIPLEITLKHSILNRTWNGLFGNEFLCAYWQYDKT